MISIKIRVFYPAYLMCLFLLVLCLFCFSVMMCMEGYKDLNLITFPITIIFLVVFPISLFIWALFTMSNTILIDENGIARYRFGKRIRMFLWAEIKTLDYTGQSLFTGWCYVSSEYKKFTYASITKMRLDKDIIYFHLSKKAIYNKDIF